MQIEFIYDSVPHFAHPCIFFASHFTGKERDTESGNDYFSARYYASSMGRFMSPDPLPWLGWQHPPEDSAKRKKKSPQEVRGLYCQSSELQHVCLREQQPAEPHRSNWNGGVPGRR